MCLSVSGIYVCSHIILHYPHSWDARDQEEVVWEWGCFPPEIVYIHYWTNNSLIVQVAITDEAVADNCLHMSVFSALPEGGVKLAYSLDPSSVKQSKLDEPLLNINPAQK